MCGVTLYIHFRYLLHRIFIHASCRRDVLVLVHREGEVPRILAHTQWPQLIVAEEVLLHAIEVILRIGVWYLLLVCIGENLVIASKEYQTLCAMAAKRI